MGRGVAVLLGTKKGTYVFRGGMARERWRVEGPYHAGQPVYHVAFDPRDGQSMYAGVNATWGGPRIEISRDLVAGARDYFQSKIANDQNEVTKRLTAIASILLLPTFIVGVYGQNFRRIPELHWGFGYAWSWGLIIVTTIAQVWYFRRKHWI